MFYVFSEHTNFSFEIKNNYEKRWCLFFWILFLYCIPSPILSSLSLLFRAINKIPLRIRINLVFLLLAATSQRCSQFHLNMYRNIFHKAETQSIVFLFRRTVCSPWPFSFPSRPAEKLCKHRNANLHTFPTFPFFFAAASFSFRKVCRIRSSRNRRSRLSKRFIPKRRSTWNAAIIRISH